MLAVAERLGRLVDRDIGRTIYRAAHSLVMLAVASLVLAACGSSASKPHPVASPIQSPLTESLAAGRRGGVLTVLSSTGFSSIDPGEAHSALDYELAYATQRPLFSYKPGMLADTAPDLASAPAEISPDGDTITVHIRRGVHFSPPVNREVTAADVAYAIERGANPNVANPYFHAYFSPLVGGEGARGGPISGISTPNSRTIVFHVIDHKAEALVHALALPLSAPVPEEYARRYDAQRPSRYGEHQVATGPYMLKSSAQGDIRGVAYRPGGSATLVRNPNWRAGTDFRAAYLAEIHFDLGGSPAANGHEVLAGSHFVQSDPPQSIVQLAAEHYRSQLQITPSAGSRYIAVNNKQGPFSNIYVREAFWAALDRNELSRAVGAPLLAELATHFLYPGIPGFHIAESLLAGRGLAYNEHPNGDLAVAQGYMKQAGYPAGMYTGKAIVSVVGSKDGPSAKVAEIADRTLHSLGFKTNLLLVGPQAMYTRYCGVPAREIDVCPDVEWHADFADGQAVLFEAFNGSSIRSTGNENWGQVNQPDLNSAIEREARVVGRASREQSWGAVDNGLVGAAVAIPLAWVRGAEIESNDVLGVGDLWNVGTWDLSFTWLK
ncbi:MAG TPA: ABC transporter substrate-binding protein [Solirubrobacteraceae bacterium]|jgi:peptide/nickel transport system substrate-binding protein|nr:ABC transporter substrate-binding protein [Solirubrobacteraceae bacterium]